MNGFTMTADTYRMAASKGRMDPAQAEKRARIYDFLGSCDQEDLYTLFDSAAFNEIAKDYLRLAARQLTAEGVLDDEQGRAVSRRFAVLFGDLTAKEVSEL